MRTPAPPPAAPDGARPCPNCGCAEVRQYCPECGQARPRPDDYSLRAYFAELTDELLRGEALRTLWTLVARPGLLTRDHLAGRRARYLRPLQLFLLVNLLLFVVAPRVPLFSYTLGNYREYAPPSPALVAALVARATAEPAGPSAGVSAALRRAAAEAAYTRAFDARVEAQRKSLIVLFAPAVALILRLLFARGAPVPGVPRRYGEHLVFAIHTLAFIWLVFTAWGGLGALAGGTLGLATRLAAAAAVVGLLLSAPVYVFRAVRRVYLLSRPRALLATAALAGAFLGLLLAYRGLLFFTTYLTL